MIKSREVQNNTLEACGKPDSQNPSMKRVPPFLLTFEIFNRNAHNCIIDLGASSNVMPVSVCKKLNVTWEPCPTQIFQLDSSRVKVVGELNKVLLTLSLDPRIHQIVDIVIVDIPKTYGMWLSRDWSKKFKGYFSTNCHICGSLIMGDQIRSKL